MTSHVCMACTPPVHYPSKPSVYSSIWQHTSYMIPTLTKPPALAAYITKLAKVRFGIIKSDRVHHDHHGPSYLNCMIKSRSSLIKVYPSMLIIDDRDC